MRTTALLIVALMGAMLAGSSAGPVSAGSDGSMALSPGKGRAADLKTTMENGNASAVFTIPDLPSGSGAYLAVELRTTDNTSSYRARARVLPDGSVYAGFSKVVDGKEKVLLSEPVKSRVRAGQKLRIEGRISGKSPVDLSVRAWTDSTAKPDWQKRINDGSATALDSAGSVRVWAYLSSSAKKPLNLGFKDLKADPSAATPAPVKPEPTKPEPTEPEPTEPTEPEPTEPTEPEPTKPEPTKSEPTKPEPTKPEPTKPEPSSGKPSAANTGVPAGTKLRRHDGNITVTKAGTVLDSLDIHGFVVVKAPNVKITNSIVRGGKATSNQGLVTNYGSPNLVVQDSELKADHPSVWLDGIKGSDYTLRRVHVVGNVDSAKVQGNNVRIERSLLENTQYYANDPNQSGGPTHNDNIQIQNGNNIAIVGNTIRGSTNFAIEAAPTKGRISNFQVLGNWVDDGHCTFKIHAKGGNGIAVTAKNNKFGDHRKIQSCAFLATPGVALQQSGNVYESNGQPIKIRRDEGN